jgi:hypothetical protein
MIYCKGCVCCFREAVLHRASATEMDGAGFSFGRTKHQQTDAEVYCKVCM